MKPVLYRYRDSEWCVKPMDGYTPSEGWTPLYDQAAIDAAVAAAQCVKPPRTEGETMTDREAFEAWWDYFTSIHDDWMYADSEALRFQAWQAATEAELERCAKVCDAIAEDKWALYKGRAPYTGKEQGRASDHTQGQSDGADQCADAIRKGEG